MHIELFKHNQAAYHSAVFMLKSKGKAAVIHPTGTGKSFIGFKLCEDHPSKKIFWLSPSDYIFKTQLENLKKATGGYTPNNLSFYTYAKLMNLSTAELSAIQPDYIILDEFHRCGAEQWGAGVNKLLQLYSKTPILGLSATAIRYLDSQRNMADELFDGNIASEISLGEAIVRGILNPPKYVLSVFSYQKELEKYQKRISGVKNRAVQDKAGPYLEALRRALEKADGLEDIFNKHITDRAGKYIVFCANIEHMHEMIKLSAGWFSKIDCSPKVYTAYANDPETSKAFAAFKKDDSRHLKLLYCIDMLNEGIHVDDISGVILLRPTVSPIVYKQQIGRALATGQKNNAVIFDVVLNIENLYSIGAIEEEMQIATAYYRSLGESGQIVNEHFKVIDEVKNCRELFEKLENVLTASWNTMYTCAEQYYKENGNLEVPARYKTAEGYSLGSWINNQRSIYKGQQVGHLSANQIKKLNSIGMRWELYTDFTWELNFQAAKDYYEAHGDLNVPGRYTTENGLRLGAWLASLRAWESCGAHPKYLTPQRKEQLESIGMVWSVLDLYWENNYAQAVRYYREHGNLLVPSNYISPSGVRLGAWISRLRSLNSGATQKGTPPTVKQIERLNAIGMNWDTNADRKWQEAFNEATLYYQQNGNLAVPSGYRTLTGFTLGQWVQNQKKYYYSGTLKPERKERLEKIGITWSRQSKWLQNYRLLQDYYQKNGTVCISQKAVINGVWLGKWLAVQKKQLQAGRLTAEQAKLLQRLPLEQCGSKTEQNWEALYRDAADFFKTNGHYRVPADYIGSSGHVLSAWITVQRRKYKLGELTPKQIKQLNAIEFEWAPENRWQRGYRYAKAYFAERGNLEVRQSYKCRDGYGLGSWLSEYRRAYNGLKSRVKITPEQIKALNDIGMVWNSGAKTERQSNSRFTESRTEIACSNRVYARLK